MSGRTHRRLFAEIVQDIRGRGAAKAEVAEQADWCVDQHTVQHDGRGDAADRPHRGLNVAAVSAMLSNDLKLLRAPRLKGLGTLGKSR